MREPSGNDKVQAPSIPEIKEGIVATAMRLGRKIKFRRRKLRPGPLINAVLLHFLSLPTDEQERLGREYLAHYEALLEHEDVQQIKERCDVPLSASGVRSVPGPVFGVHETPRKSGELNRDHKVTKKPTAPKRRP